MTPETLRDKAYGMRNAFAKGTTEGILAALWADELDAAADTWEAEELEAAIAASRAIDVIEDLRKQLFASEQARQRAEDENATLRAYLVKLREVRIVSGDSTALAQTKDADAGPEVTDE